MKTVEVLEQAKALIAEPNYWIKGANATDSDGVATAIQSQHACRFCMNGALHRVTGWDIDGIKAYDDARRTLYTVLGENSVHRFNDKPETTHADVMKVFDKAIGLAKSVETVLNNLRKAQ